MAQTEKPTSRWFLRQTGEGGTFTGRITNWLHGILMSCLGVRVTSVHSFVFTEHWPRQLLYFQRLFKLIQNVEGDIVECGVWFGYGLFSLAVLVEGSGVRRHIWGFDSFQGLPAPKKEDLASPKAIAKKGALVAKEETVLRNLKNFGLDEQFINDQVTLVKGWFSETLPKHRGSSIAFLHLDPDLYESYKTALENLWPEVSVGGIVTLDAYGDTDLFPGAKKAVDEYFSQHRDVIIHRDALFNKYYAVKLG